MRRVFLRGWVLIVGLTGLAVAADSLADAKKLAQVGKTAEALEAFDKFKSDAKFAGKPEQTAIALGRAECLATQGETEKALETLDAVAKDQPENPDLLAAIGELQFGRGNWVEADANAQAALKVNPDHLAARWLAVRILQAHGDFEKAVAASKAIVGLYNANNGKYAKNADSLLIIGQAAEAYYRASARGEELSESLNDVINELYEGAIKADPNCWKATWLQGKLFLSGYLEGSAKKELARSMKINPSAPEVLVTLGQADLQGFKLASGRTKAERALEVNPHYIPALVLLADLNISDEKFADALAAARKAVAENPKDEDALARLAASYRLLVKPNEAATVEAFALENNPKPVQFYATLGERLADRRKYPSAERAFLLGAQADPSRAESKIGLGMLYMQIGRETEARNLFDTAFAADPFNVRADNMMKILKHLATYKELNTEHYTFLFDAKQDELLAGYMAEYMEKVHPELVKTLGYEPAGLTKIEIMKDHEKFSGRTVALPFIPTIGACTGKIFALASPTSTKKPFNWARVMKHEMTHVINLQQTDFNIPHWYTECLAVESEQAPRPQPWNKLLLERVPTRKLLNLDTINLGFIRPKEADDRQMAYCQAQLYGQYMVKRFGPDAHLKMLRAYRRGLTTEGAIKDCFNVDKADFEAKYLTFLDDVLKTIRVRVDEEEPVKFSELLKQLKAKPDDADLNAKVAYEHFARRDLQEARPLADKALELQPNHPLAAYVKARLLLSIGDSDGAMAVIEPAFNATKPNERVVDLLAELTMKAGQLDQAEKLYEIARKDDPYSTKWIAGLARVHLRQKEPAKFLDDLAAIAANDADDFAIRKTLAERHLAAEHYEEALHWGYECIYIDVKDPIGHSVIADALVGEKKYAKAIAEYQVALTLKPKGPDLIRVRMAQAQLDSGDRKAAIDTLDGILKRDPEQPEAFALRAKIGKGE